MIHEIRVVSNESGRSDRGVTLDGQRRSSSQVVICDVERGVHSHGRFRVPINSLAAFASSGCSCLQNTILKLNETQQLGPLCKGETGPFLEGNGSLPPALGGGPRGERICVVVLHRLHERFLQTYR